VSDNDKNSDLLWGAEAIGAAIGRSPRAAFHMLEAGLLPAKRVGRRWVASREKLLRAVIGDSVSRETEVLPKDRTR
jgi:hypothetical protein